MADHPLTPPPELVAQWMTEAHDQPPGPDARVIATQAARWGADQELEACCGWLRNDGLFETRIGHLRTARRPKPPSLKEQALADLDSLVSDLNNLGMGFKVTNIIRALEALDD